MTIRRVQRLAVLPVLVLVASLATACSSSGKNGGSGKNASGSTLKIGVLAELTGDGAVIGVPYVNGVKMAANQINAAGGIKGHKISLKVLDSQTQPNTAVQAAAQLINIDHVSIIDCSCFSVDYFPVVKYANQHKVVVIDGYGASSPLVRTLPPDFVSLSELDDTGTAVLAQYVYSRGDHTAALLTDTDQYGVGFRSGFKAAFEKLGGKISVDIVGTPNLTDYRAQLQRLTSQQSKFDVVASSVAFTEGELQFKQYYQLGGRKPWAELYPTGSGFDTLPQANGRTYGLQVALNSGQAAAWSTAYQKLYGAKDFQKNELEGGLGYDSIQWTSRALIDRSGTSVAATRAAFKTAAGEYSSGPTGKLQFDSDYARINMTFAKFELQNGKWVQVGS